MHDGGGGFSGGQHSAGHHGGHHHAGGQPGTPGVDPVVTGSTGRGPLSGRFGLMVVGFAVLMIFLMLVLNR